MSHISGQLPCVGSCVDDFVENYVGACHLKDIQTGQYLLGNFNIVQSLKFESVDNFIGLTIHDLCSDGGVYKNHLNPSILDWKNKEIEKIKKLEYRHNPQSSLSALKASILRLMDLFSLKE